MDYRFRGNDAKLLATFRYVSAYARRPESMPERSAALISAYHRSPSSPIGANKAPGVTNERHSPHPVPLPLGEGTPLHASCVVYEAVRLTQRPFSQGEKDRMRGEPLGLARHLVRLRGATPRRVGAQNSLPERGATTGFSITTVGRGPGRDAAKSGVSCCIFIATLSQAPSRKL